MTWLSAFREFLFAATAVALDKSQFLVTVIATLGFVVAFFSGLSLMAANKAFVDSMAGGWGKTHDSSGPSTPVTAHSFK
jgi:hypothetical protein